jgi:uncharacterized protein (TIGR00159 family)
MLAFGIKDLIDILLVAIGLYYCYKVMKQSRSVNIFYGVLFFISFWIVVSKVLEMKLVGGILDKLVNVGAIAIIILFQEEIRQFFFRMGARRRIHRFINFFKPDKKKVFSEFVHERETIFPIVMACLNMSKQRVGALIVLQNNLPLNDFVRTGELVNAKISQRLIENIFFKNSPLHDGALIISGSKIMSAGCILPVSHDTSIPRYLGLRHRSAKGIAQATDAIAIVVSEETGRISYAHKGELHLNLSSTDLEHALSALVEND